MKAMIKATDYSCTGVPEDGYDFTLSGAVKIVVKWCVTTLKTMLTEKR